MTEYRSLHDFYAEVPRRESSPEYDFGVDWVCPSVAGSTTWRVSWIVETGEVYAFEQGGAGRVKVLGYVPKNGSYPYQKPEDWAAFKEAQEIERTLEGWAEAEPKRLAWVEGRLANRLAAKA